VGNAATIVPALAWFRPSAAAANGLVLFPPESLSNRYFLLRAGETVAEAADRIESNPIATLGPTSFLTEKGAAQVLASAAALEAAGLDGGGGCWCYYNKAAPSQQSALVLQRALGIGTSQMVPDFAWLDPRGCGALEGEQLARLAEVRALDAANADARPAPAEDGTPSESASDLLVRVRNIISILETSYSGADVVLVSPSSDVLSVLFAAATGVPLREHSTFSLGPGQFRILDLRELG
jgi:broad specificity phosphatase PhoE